MWASRKLTLPACVPGPGPVLMVTAVPACKARVMSDDKICALSPLAVK